jgi:hypothetical protein
VKQKLTSKRPAGAHALTGLFRFSFLSPQIFAMIPGSGALLPLAMRLLTISGIHGGAYLLLAAVAARNFYLLLTFGPLPLSVPDEGVLIAQ